MVGSCASRPLGGRIECRMRSEQRLHAAKPYCTFHFAFFTGLRTSDKKQPPTTRSASLNRVPRTDGRTQPSHFAFCTGRTILDKKQPSTPIGVVDVLEYAGARFVFQNELAGGCALRSQGSLNRVQNAKCKMVRLWAPRSLGRLNRVQNAKFKVQNGPALGAEVSGAPESSAKCKVQNGPDLGAEVAGRPNRVPNAN
jgi:hypothetical protein